MTTFSNTVTRACVGFAGITVGAILCFGAAATPVQASTDDKLPTISVSYADLNLGSTAGRRQLDRRLHSAAHQVCDSGSLGIQQASIEHKCIALALANVRSPVVR